MFVVGIILVFVLMSAVSLLSSRRVSNASDFDSAGGKASSPVVAGAIIGTLVGGSSTVGTAQLAYHYGLSAWWFTLGGGIACLILALVYVKPFRRSGGKTLIGILSAEYGTTVGMTASLLSSVGTFLSILSQIISATAVLVILFPGMSTAATILTAVLLMVVYVIFGGVLGAGVVGLVKTFLLYAAVIVSAVIVLMETGGMSVLVDTLDPAVYFNLFARGVGTDGGACLSLILGVLCTQSYAQAIFAGKTDREARKGALISACCIPPIGVGGILVGLYMRACGPELQSAKLAFPRFIMDHLSPLPAGVVMATLLVTIVGTGAGLSLGISSVVYNDVAQKILRKTPDQKGRLVFLRVIIVAVLLAAGVLCMMPIGDTILNFSFMSMGLRGAVLFVPLGCALWLRGRIQPLWIMLAMIISPLVILVLGVTDLPVGDPLFAGVLVSVLFCAVGAMIHKKP